MKHSIPLSLTMIGILMSTPALAQSHSGNASGGTGVSENVDSSKEKMNNDNQANDSNPSNATASNTNGNSDWNAQNKYWRQEYSSRPYYKSTQKYSMYEPAYRYGVDMYNQHPDTPYSQLSQSDLEQGWSQARGESKLSWNQAQAATRDAYTHAYNNSNQ